MVKHVDVLIFHRSDLDTRNLRLDLFLTLSVAAIVFSSASFTACNVFMPVTVAVGRYRHGNIAL